ncbi:MAG: nuclear transport factor 2 family protein [Saprospiraceae bacterium]|nr:nuclear transport factor 2 family protein [Saprospiraceae bacterium]
MKKINLLIVLILLIGSTVNAQKAEKKAIIKVIEAEHLAYSQRNLEKMASYYAQSENSVAGDAITFTAKGWEENFKGYQSYFADYPNPVEPRIGYKYDISISGDKAWVTFNQKKKNAEQDKTKQLRILVKQNGEWKITGMLFFGL